jgi:2-polyprenyl-3-methyl-5-hydroxy-6-metoxy-1,4-benzoquinol methylase
LERKALAALLDRPKRCPGALPFSQISAKRMIFERLNQEDEPMNFRQLLAFRGIHYLATRFGWKKLRSQAFDAKYKSGDWSFRNEGSGELADVVRRYLNSGDLLIMGCGGASILKDFKASELKSSLGIDLSEEAIRLASHFSSKTISFRVADMTTFKCPYPVDVILFSESLNYVPEIRQEALLRRLAADLKPTGAFVVTFAQSIRYKDMLDGIRHNFQVLEDKTFSGSIRHLIVFRLRPPG